MAKAIDNVEPIHGIRLTISALAREFNVSRDTVNRRFSQARVVPVGENDRGYATYALKDAAMAILEVRGECQNYNDIDPATLPPSERALLAKARLDETKKKIEDLKVDQAEGTVVSVEDCREQMAIMKNAFVHMVDTLPDILERDCELSSAAVSKVESICDDLRIKLAEELMS